MVGTTRGRVNFFLRIFFTRHPDREAYAERAACARLLMVADQDFADWLRLIRAEYLELPGLHLTKPQAARLWGLDATTSEVLLDALVEAHFLRRTFHDTYVRAEDG